MEFYTWPLQTKYSNSFIQSFFRISWNQYFKVIFCICTSCYWFEIIMFPSLCSSIIFFFKACYQFIKKFLVDNEIQKCFFELFIYYTKKKICFLFLNDYTTITKNTCWLLFTTKKMKNFHHFLKNWNNTLHRSKQDRI